MGNAVSPVVAGALGRCLAKAAAATSPAGEAVISVPDPVAEAVSILLTIWLPESVGQSNGSSCLRRAFRIWKHEHAQ